MEHDQYKFSNRTRWSKGKAYQVSGGSHQNGYCCSMILKFCKGFQKGLLFEPSYKII